MNVLNSRARLSLFGVALLAAVVGVVALVGPGGSGASQEPVDQLEFVDPTDPRSPDQTGTLAWIESGYAAKPRPLTASECADAAPRMEAQAQMLAVAVERQSPDNSLLQGQLAAAVADSREWFTDGCRPHPVLGYYDALDGSGGIKSILIQFP